MEIKKIAGLYLAIAAGLLLSLPSCAKQEQDDGFNYVPRTAVGKILQERSEEVAYVMQDTSFIITPGVEETDLKLEMKSGFRQTCYIISVNTALPGLSLRVALPEKVGTSWKRATLSSMAAQISVPGQRVVAMINGDYWDTQSPIKPRGPIKCGGVTYLDKFNYVDTKPQQALSFVGIDNTGKMVIDEKAAYPAIKASLKECTGAGVILLKDGEFPGTQWTALDPRTSIGYSADGMVYLLVCDGRKRFGADGMSYTDMSSIFKGLGCKGATTLDGGGSAQMLIRNPVANVYQIRNRPADGQERPVINMWAVVSDEP